MKKTIVLFIIISIAATFTECKKVPYTDRNQVTLIPESTLIAMAAEQYETVLSTSQLDMESPDYQLVRGCGRKIATAVEEYLKNNGMGKRVSEFSWEYNLIVDDIVNAWCMPGGKIAFYTGILPICQNEKGIAVVMGHEISHAVARHGNERMSQELLLQAGGTALSVFMQSKPEVTQQVFASIYGIGAEYGVQLPYSRKHETEADHLGLIFMAMAGYNPQYAVEFWERMAENGTNVPEFMSTHPSDQTRINNIKSFLPEAMEIYNQRVGTN